MLRLCSTLVVVVSLCAPGMAATITVDPSGSEDYTEIQPAIDAAADGDTVLVKRGEYVIREPLDLNRLHDPDDLATPSVKNIVLASEEGAGGTTIRMDASPLDPSRASVVVAEKGEGLDSVVEGFTLTGGRGSGTTSTTYGGAIFCALDSALAVRDCVIVENSAAYGGAVSCSFVSHVELSNCIVAGNSAGTGGGVYCTTHSSVTLTHCTITGNVGRRGGGLFLAESSGSVTGGIIRDNAGGSIEVGEWDALHMDISLSCIEGLPVQGGGNIDEDPLFCAWDSAEVWVNAAGGGVPDGTETRPYRDLASALDASLYSLALSAGSPCLGTGPGGSNMGADTGLCDREPVPTRLVHVARGIYDLAGASLVHRVSLEGAGETDTILEGSVRSLRTGCLLSDATVTSADDSGIVVASGESPGILRCSIVDCLEKGVDCFKATPEFTECTIARSGLTGVDCYDSAALLTDCVLSGNGLDGLAARGLCDDICWGAAPTLIGCTISDNARRGVSASEGVEPVFTGCAILANEIVGLFFGSETSGTIENCTILSNGGSGVSQAWTGRPELVNCTISGNAGHGVDASFGAPTLANSVVWGNGGAAIYVDEDPKVKVSYSCIENASVWPGEGNINADPLFCGWGDAEEAYVDARSPSPGDGSAAHPYPDLERALEYSAALSATSPCLGSGQGGADMGADTGRCDSPGASARTVHVASGTYSLVGTTLAHPASLLGAGEGVTVIEGTVRGLRTGMVLSGLTVTRGEVGGIIVGAGQSPEIIDCRITLNRTSTSGAGVRCLDGAAPLFRGCTIEGNSTEWTGGGVQCEPGSSPRLESCVISWNSARYAAAVNCREESSPVFVNCTIQGNVTRDEGAALEISWDSTPRLEHCTIMGNAGDGLHCQWGSVPTLESCIVWGNTGAAFDVESGASPGVTYSCIEGEDGPSGRGNTNADPLFCGWGDRAEVYVDDSYPGEGDGSAGRPYSSLTAAVNSSLALADGSPCLGTGAQGDDMGAPHGVCAMPGVGLRLVHLRSGTYLADGVSLAGGVVLEGTRATDVVLEGPVSGLQTEGGLSRVTVTGGVDGGVIVNRDRSPRLTECRIRDNPGDGVLCREGASPVLDRCVIESNGHRGVRCTEDASPVLTDCEIVGNLDGGMECSQGSSPRMMRCTYSGNESSVGGALEVRGDSHPFLVDCRLLGNHARGNGGALLCGSSARPQLINCELYGNLAEKAGGAIYCESDGAPVLLNCTLTANGGGGVDCESGARGGSLTNCIVQGNIPPTVCGSFSFCVTDEDPLFVRPGVVDFERFSTVEVGGEEAEVPDFIVQAPDLRLRAGSPAIEVGTSNGAPDADLTGKLRPCGVEVDIGAHESGACGLSRRRVTTELGPEPEVVVDDGTAIAFHGMLSPSDGLEDVVLQAARFRNTGPGDASRIVTEARLYEDDGDGIFTDADRAMGPPATFDSASGEVILGAMDEPLDPAVPLAFFLVCKVQSPAPAQGSMPPVGPWPGGDAGPLLLFLLLLLVIAAGRRRVTFRWASVGVLCVVCLLLPGGSGCGGGGGGGGGAASTTELRMQLEDLDATSQVTLQQLEPVGLPLPAWPFEA